MHAPLSPRTRFVFVDIKPVRLHWAYFLSDGMGVREVFGL